MHPQTHPLSLHFVFTLVKTHPQTHSQVHLQHKKTVFSAVQTNRKHRHEYKYRLKAA